MERTPQVVEGAGVQAPAHDFAAIVRAIRAGYLLPWAGFHGVTHWARVWENGVRIAQMTGADLEVVRLFALFHDARRENERRDPGHGQRGADLAESWRGTLVHLDDDRFQVLAEACRRHTDGRTTEEATIGACWDADRLDLGRVGIKPAKHLLCCSSARDLIRWADARATRFHVPGQTLESWGVVDL